MLLSFGQKRCENLLCAGFIVYLLLCGFFIRIISSEQNLVTNKNCDNISKKCKTMPTECITRKFSKVFMVKISSKVTGVILSNGCITPTTCLILFEFSAKIPFLKYLVG